ncbi:hypothetical protein L195_g019352 [Trifolium pratense]|uniref:Uncharacterized protein n=1 Tax=Trifolium pratense TaxID=57577 RepID=A0A2K3MZC7_TRIPR|nr:hypothetical protein L195_g019352 [Trifolium pratense]
MSVFCFLVFWLIVVASRWVVFYFWVLDCGCFDSATFMVVVFRFMVSD